MANCKICDTPLELHEGGFRKDGTEYKEFWGCPNYKDDQHKQAKTEWKNKQQKLTAQLDKTALLMDEFTALNKRFDSLVSYLVKKLGSPDEE